MERMSGNGMKGAFCATLLVGITSFLGCAAEPSDKTDDLAVARDMAVARDLTTPKCSTNAECRSEFDRSAVCCPESKTCAPTREECPAVPDLAEPGDMSVVSDLLIESDLFMCPMGQTLCPSGCSNLASDPANCGACDNACPSKLCQAGVCFEPASCTNGKKDGDETGQDCGGSCKGCPVDGPCASDNDCANGLICTGGKCAKPAQSDLATESKDLKMGGDDAQPPADAGTDSAMGDLAKPMDLSEPKDLTVTPKCDDKVKNGDETDTDCGGAKCPKCDLGKKCFGGNDCLSAVCTNNLCAMPPNLCKNGQKDGAETDVDCGSSCGPCDDGKGCVDGVDCKSGVCTNKLCVAASCTDKVKNGDETDTDCGGKCLMQCADGKGCKLPTDCVSKICTGGKCAGPQCNDKVKNGAETDVDCGGGSCSGCGDGKKCVKGGDCASGVCKGNLCQAPTCWDNVKNANETDVDCGGRCGATCYGGQKCSSALDCQSKVCNLGTCVWYTCFDGIINGNETDRDCGGNWCNGCSVGEKCLEHSDCLSKYCVGGRCFKDTCIDGIKNGEETAADCGGSVCIQCEDNRSCKADRDCKSQYCDQQTWTCKPAPLCKPPQASCNNSCTDTNTDPKNCGGCGKACAQGQSCVSGACQGACGGKNISCPAGTTALHIAYDDTVKLNFGKLENGKIVATTPLEAKMLMACCLNADGYCQPPEGWTPWPQCKEVVNGGTLGVNCHPGTGALLSQEGFCSFGTMTPKCYTPVSTDPKVQLPQPQKGVNCTE